MCWTLRGKGREEWSSWFNFNLCEGIKSHIQQNRITHTQVRKIWKSFENANLRRTKGFSAYAYRAYALEAVILKQKDFSIKVCVGTRKGKKKKQ